MKKTVSINHSRFKKLMPAFKIAPIALTLSAVLFLSGCEKTDETVHIYKDAKECSQSSPDLAQQCQVAYNEALVQASQTAPKYTTQAECEKDYGAQQCVIAPQQALASNQTTQAQPTQNSIFMPMMTGFMLGRLMSGGFAQSPLFSSQTAAGQKQFVDAKGKNYGPAQTNRTARVTPTNLTPSQAKSSTVTRGGFGQSSQSKMTTSGG